VPDESYKDVVFQLAANARRWFLASIFIVDTRTGVRKTPDVVHLVQALGDAVARGLFVRVILGGSDRNFTLADIAFGAEALFRSYGVPCKIASRKGITTHKKLVIADDFTLLGSHNWSEGAWTNQRQDSVLIKDSGLAAFMSEWVRRDWEALSKGNE